MTGGTLEEARDGEGKLSRQKLRNGDREEGG